ncbi:hypothetical protein CHS0354_023515 [Potamilus streckersoni]|uniref:Caspase-3 n=1 Tax=Potamilus streckersoni TaxID=2493646 RepID=A0AAE0VKK1_9BIVA|nr:hypothetical protein CHS0354_023515 [Potamilus streckersoni]
MADETDPCFWKRKKKKQPYQHSSEKYDEPYGFDAKDLTGNSVTYKDERANDSHRETGVSLEYVPGTIPDPGIFPYYYHREPIRGSAIFVVNQEFRSYRNRYGAENDLLYLKSVFVDQLGFKQLNKEADFNLTLSQLDDVLKNAISKDYNDTDFFIFAISTHGEERPRRSQQFQPALVCRDDQYKFIMDVINSFDRCATLAGKPKIFLIQACRIRSDSNEKVFPDPKGLDKGLEFTLTSKKEERDSKQKRSDRADTNDKAGANNEVVKEEANIDDKEDTKTDEKDEMYAYAGERDKADDANANIKDEADAGHKKDDYQKRTESGFESKPVISLINIQKDCLVVYAIQSGMYAWRHRTTGSWLFVELSNAMKEHASQSPINFLDILTKTAFKMAQRETSGGFKAVSVIQHRLTKDLLIPLKHRQT